MTLLNVLSHYIGQFKYGRTLAIAVLAVLGIVVIGFSFRWWNQYRTEKAHAALARAIELFERADQENTPNAWEEADQAFGQGYAQNSGSSLAPYFLAFQSEIALRQGNTEKARQYLGDAVKAMVVGGIFYSSYAVKLALMQKDSGNPDLVEKGTKALQQLVDNPRNNDRDMALYYQGLLLFQGGDRAGAEKVWQPLLEMRGADSLWAQAAQAKLDYTA